jgi:hypothetical protein
VHAPLLHRTLLHRTLLHRTPAAAAAADVGGRGSVETELDACSAVRPALRSTTALEPEIISIRGSNSSRPSPPRFAPVFIFEKWGCKCAATHVKIEFQTKVQF